jgi:hypothetical protein
MTAVKLLAIVGAVSILVGLGLTSLPMILNPRAEGGMHGAGFNPSDFALATHFFGLIVMIIGALMLIAAAVIARNSN